MPRHKGRLGKAASRTTRTGGQLGIAAVITALIEAFFPGGFSTEQIAAIGAALTLVVTFVQNALESRGVIPHVLEEPVGTEATKPKVAGTN